MAKKKTMGSVSLFFINYAHRNDFDDLDLAKNYRKNHRVQVSPNQSMSYGEYYDRVQKEQIHDRRKKEEEIERQIQKLKNDDKEASSSWFDKNVVKPVENWFNEQVALPISDFFSKDWVRSLGKKQALGVFSMAQDDLMKELLNKLDAEKVKLYYDLIDKYNQLNDLLQQRYEQMKDNGGSSAQIDKNNQLYQRLLNEMSGIDFSTGEPKTIGQQLSQLQQQIKLLDDYFLGEGRTHDVIADVMFDPNKLDGLQQATAAMSYMNAKLNYDTLFDYKSWDSKKPWYQNLADVTLGNVLEGLQYMYSNTLEGPMHTALNYLQGAMDAVLPDSWTGDYDGKYVQGFIKNANVNNPQDRRLLGVAYNGISPNGIAWSPGQIRKDNPNLTNVGQKLGQWEEATNRRYNEKLKTVQDEMDWYLHGSAHNLLGLDLNKFTNGEGIDIFDPEKIDKGFQKRQEEKSGSWNPLNLVYNLPELGSSYSMMKTMAEMTAADIAFTALTRKLPAGVLKLNSATKALQDMSKLGKMTRGEIAALRAKELQTAGKLEEAASFAQTGLMTANAGTSLYLVSANRAQETALEKMDALTSRTMETAVANGANMKNVLNEIRDTAANLNLNAEGMTGQDLVLLGISLNMSTGDQAFDSATREARKGINKLVNANNALAYSDYLQALPFMSYGGSALNTFSKYMFGATERNAIKKMLPNANEQIISNLQKQAMHANAPSVRAFYDSLIQKAGTKLVEKDAPKLALMTKHTSDFLVNAGSKYLPVGLTEGVEEGVQHLLQQRYMRGDYDDYTKSTSVFSVPEVFSDLDLSAQALAGYTGLNFGDPDNGSAELRKAMNIGAVVGMLQPMGQSVLRNAINPLLSEKYRSDDPALFSNYVAQMKNDWVLNRMIGSNYNAVDDANHVGLFFDMFHHTGVDRGRLAKSLNDFKSFLGQEGNSLVSPEYVDRDIQLMNAAWSVYKNKDIDGSLKEMGIDKYSDKHKLLVQQGARAIVDAQMTQELLRKQGAEYTKTMNEESEKFIELINNPNSESSQKTKQENPFLAVVADSIRKQYDSHKTAYGLQQTTKALNFKKNLAENRDAFVSNSDVRQAIDDWLTFQQWDADQYSDDILSEMSTEVQAKINGVLNKKSKNLKELKKKREHARKLAKQFAQLKKEGVSPEEIYQKVWNDKGFREVIIDDVASRHFDERQESFDVFGSDSSKNPNSAGLITLEDFAARRYRILMQHMFNERARKMRDKLTDRHATLTSVRKMTGLDVNTDNIKGMIDELDSVLKGLGEQEQSTMKAYNEHRGLSGDDRVGYQALFEDLYQQLDNDESILQGREDVFSLIDKMILNQSVLGPQLVLANAYTRAEVNPANVRRAIFSGDANSIFEQLENEWSQENAEYQALNELERSPEKHEMLTRGIRRKSFQKLVQHDLEQAEKRKKIAHRQWVEDSPITGEIVEMADNGDEAAVEKLQQAGAEQLQQDSDLIPVETEASKRGRELFLGADIQEEERQKQIQDEIDRVMAQREEEKEEAETEREEGEDNNGAEEEHSTGELAEQEIAAQADIDFFINDYGKLHTEWENGDPVLYYEGKIVPEDYIKQLKEETELLMSIDLANRFDAAIGIDGFSSNRNELVGKDDVWSDYLSQTFFYQPKAAEAMKLNAKLPFELRSGQELSKKLTEKGWIESCEKYYIVTRDSLAEEIDPNNNDLYTVALIIEDKANKTCYATALHRVGESKYYNLDENGNRIDEERGPISKSYTNDLRERLERLNIDEDKIPGETYRDKIKNAQLSIARSYYQITHPNDQQPSESDGELYAMWIGRVNRWLNGTVKIDQNDVEKSNQDLDTMRKFRQEIRTKARLMMARYGKSILTAEQIDQQIEALRQHRNQIIDAYLTKTSDGKSYIFPEQIRKDVVPEQINISNGVINSMRNGVVPQFRNVEDGTAADIQQKIDDGQIVLGLGLGTKADSLMRFHIRGIGDDATSDYSFTEPGGRVRNKGLGGKIYMIVETHNGSQVPIMLSESKFNKQRVGNRTKYISKPSDVTLCIDPITGEILQTENAHASTAELLLYLITNRLNTNQIPDAKLLKEIANLYIHCDPKTLLNGDERHLHTEELLNAYAAKQLSYEVEDVGNRKEGILRIGIKLPNGIYKQQAFTLNELFGENSEETRKTVVSAIATQMHQNTEEADMTEHFSDRFINFLRDYFRQNQDATELRLFDNDEFVFKKNDFFDDKMAYKRISVVAWMLANGKLMTDLSKEQPFSAPFVFATGVKTTKAAQAVLNLQDAANDVVAGVKDGAKPEKVAPVTTESEILNSEKIESIRRNSKSKSMKNLQVHSELQARQSVLDELSRTQIAQQNGGVIEYLVFDMGDVKTQYQNSDEYKAAAQEKIEKLKSYIKDKYDVDLNVTESSASNDMNVAQFKTGFIVPELTVFKNGTAQLVYRNLKGKGTTYTMSTKGVTGVYSNVRGSGQMDENSAREWIQETLGIDPSQVIVTNAIMRGCKNEQVFGVVNVAVDRLAQDTPIGVIMLSRQAGTGIEYHEAWHYVNLLLHDERTRATIYKEFRKRHSELKFATNLEVEEAMAEDFRGWANIQNRKGISGILLRAYDRFKTFILTLAGKKPQYLQIYNAIQNREYRGAKLDLKSTMEFAKRYPTGAKASYKIPGVKDETLDKMTAVTGYRDFYEAGYAIVNHMLNELAIDTTELLKRIANNQKLIMELIVNLANMQDNPTTQQMIMDFYDNPSAFLHIMLELFLQMGITVKVKKLSQIKSNEDSVIPVGDNIDENPQEDALAKENSDTPDNTWDRFDLSLSRKDNAATRTKLFLRRIPQTRRIINADGSVDYYYVRNKFGVVENVPINEVWNKLLEDLWDSETYDAKSEDGTYKSTSLVGKAERLSKSDAFYKAVLDKLLAIDDENDIELKNLIFATMNSSKPQVSFFEIGDPIQRKMSMVGMEGMSTEQVLETQASRDSVVAGETREWVWRGDNRLRAINSVPRRWSAAAMLNGLADSNGHLSEGFVKHVCEELHGINTDMAKKFGWKTTDQSKSLVGMIEKTRNKKKTAVLSEANKQELVEKIEQKLIDLYRFMGIDIDAQVLEAYMINHVPEGQRTNITASAKLAAYSKILTKSTGKGGLAGSLAHISKILQNTLEMHKRGENLGMLKVSGFKNGKAVDELFDRFKSTGKEEASGILGYSEMAKLALAHSRIHPTSQEFSVRGPNGDMLYPISQNNSISDDTRWLNTDLDYVQGLLSCPYANHSLILNAAENYMQNGNTGRNFTLNAFVGLKDKDKLLGEDYFGITPLEDYLSKLFMTEQDQIVLPTMADKKTWYSLSGENLQLVHDIVHVGMFEDAKFAAKTLLYLQATGDVSATVEDVENFAKEHKNDAEYNSQYAQLAYQYNIQHHANEYRRFSTSTLNIFANCFLDEINSLLEYYSTENVKRLVNNANARIENFDGKVKDGRLLFGGNGGKFRYFYDIIKYSDGCNLNQRIQALWELQKAIENGEVKNIKAKPGDPKQVVSLSDILEDGQDPKDLDGFELVRRFLNSMKDAFYNTNGFAEQRIHNILNNKLISMVDSEMKTLCGDGIREKSLKLLQYDEKKKQYYNYGIPQQLIDKYIDTISEKYGRKELRASEAEYSAIYSIVANNVVNHIISTMEVEKVFTGDPADYSWKGPKSSKSVKVNTSMLLGENVAAEMNVKVDVVLDKSSDKIKRLGSTLSPGEEVRLQYSQEEIDDYGTELACDKYTNLNIEDLEAQSLFLDEIEQNFKRQILIDLIRSKNPQWFTKEFIPNLEKSRNEKLSYNTALDIILTDEDAYNLAVKHLSNQQAKQVQSTLKAQMKPYTKINVADAQVLIRPAMYRRIRIGLGQWTFNPDKNGYSDEEAYNILMSGKDWMHDEELAKKVRKFQIFPLKMSYFQNKRVSDGRVLAMLNKMCIFAWFPHMATTPVGKLIYERMNREGNELDMISFKSAVKVGAKQNAITPTANSYSVEDQLSTIDKLFKQDSDVHLDYKNNKIKQSSNKDRLAVHVQYLNCLRMQLNTKAHEAEERAIGTQMFKILFSNIIDTVSYGTGKSGRQRRSGQQVKEDIMACLHALTVIGENNIQDRFYKEGQDGKMHINKAAVIDFVKSVVKSNGLGSAASEIINEGGVVASLMSRQVFENSIAAIVNGEIVKINTKGGTAVQLSSFGFVGHGATTVATQNGDDLSDEDGYRSYNGGKELKWSVKDGSMQVMLSMNFFKPVVPKEYQNSYEQMRNWLVENNIIGDNAKPFGVGYRIPTQGMSSTFAFQVADVLPEQSGDLIVVPREFTAQTGSDFDVDKLFLATMSYTNGTLDTMDEDAIKEMSTAEKMEYLSKQSVGSVLNRLLLNYIDIVSDMHNYAQSRGSIDVITNKIKDELLPKLQNKSSDYFEGMRDLTPSYQSFRKQEFSTGKSGIGPFALNITNLALTQYTHLRMDYGDNEYNLGDLDAMYGEDDQLVANWLSAMVNAHVDVAKDPYIFDLNVNKQTYNHANFLIRAGKAMSTFTFLAQPILRTYASRLNTAQSIYGKNFSEADEKDNKVNKKNIVRELISNELDECQKLYKQLKEEAKENGKTIANQKLINAAMLYFAVETSGKKKKGDKSEFNNKTHDVFDTNLAYEALEYYDLNRIENPSFDDKVKHLMARIFQMHVMQAFMDINPYAQAMSQLVTLSQIDTEKFGKTIAEQMHFRNKYEQFKFLEAGTKVSWYIAGKNLEKSNYTGTDPVKIKLQTLKNAQYALHQYFTKMFLDDKFYRATRWVKAILKNQTFTATNEFASLVRTLCALFSEQVEYTDAFNEVTYKGYSTKLKKDTVLAISQATDTIMRFFTLMNTGSKIYEDLMIKNNYTEKTTPIDFTCGGDINLVKQKLRQLVFGDENNGNLADRIGNFVKNIQNHPENDYADGIVDEDGEIRNELLRFLVPQQKSNKFPVSRITLLHSQMNVGQDYKSKLISAFHQLLTHDNARVRELARDLAFYAYYSTYDLNTVNSFFDLVPTEFRVQYDRALRQALSRPVNVALAIIPSIKNYKEFDDAIQDANGEGRRILDIMCRNFANDDAIVPTVEISKKQRVRKFDRWGGVFMEQPVASKQRTGSIYGVIASTDHVTPYIKVKKDGVLYLYKKVGRVDRKSGEKNATPFNIYMAVSAAGIHNGKNHMYEFYADGNTNSIFAGVENTSTVLPNSWAHENLRQIIQNAVDNSDAQKYSYSIVYENEAIPVIYQAQNTELYAPPVAQPRLGDVNENGTVQILVKSKEKRNQICQSSDIIIDINTDEHSQLDKTKAKTIKFDQSKDVSEQVSAGLNNTALQNPDMFVSQSMVDKINQQMQTTDLVQQLSTGAFVYINGELADVTVSDEEVEQYIVDNYNIPEDEEVIDQIRQDASMAILQQKKNQIMNDLVQKLLLSGINIRKIRCVGGNPTTTAAMNAVMNNRLYFAETDKYPAVVYVTGKFADNKDAYNAFKSTISDENAAGSVSISENTDGLLQVMKDQHSKVYDIMRQIQSGAIEAAESATKDVNKQREQILKEARQLAEQAPTKKKGLGGLRSTGAESVDIGVVDAKAKNDSESALPKKKGLGGLRNAGAEQAGVGIAETAKKRDDSQKC